MIAFIDDHRDVYGVEPICRVLPTAASTYYLQAGRRPDPRRAAARARLGRTLARYRATAEARRRKALHRWIAEIAKRPQVPA